MAYFEDPAADLLASTRAAALCPTAASPTAASPPCPPHIGRLPSAETRHHSTQSTLALISILDITALVVLLLTTATTLLLTYRRTCGMKNAEYRAMCICAVIGLSAAALLVTAILAACLDADKHTLIARLPPFAAQLEAQSALHDLIYAQLATAILAVLFLILLALISVYYVDEFTSDALYLPVKSRPARARDLWGFAI